MQMLICTVYAYTLLCKSLSFDMLLRFSLIVNCREYPPEIVPVMMFASRTAGLMAHFREAMSKSDLTVSEFQKLTLHSTQKPDLETSADLRGRLLSGGGRPTSPVDEQVRRRWQECEYSRRISIVSSHDI
jgi:hypothetical protein